MDQPRVAGWGVVCAERGFLAPRLSSLSLENHKCVGSECPQGGPSQSPCRYRIYILPDQQIATRRDLAGIPPVDPPIPPRIRHARRALTA